MSSSKRPGVELGEQHPRVTMLIAQQAHLLSVLLDRHGVDAGLVQQGYEAAYRRDAALLDQAIEQIRSSNKHALRTARRVATGATLTSGMHRGEADRALKKLVEIGAIEHRARSDYRVVNPLLRRRLIEGQVWYAG